MIMKSKKKSWNGFQREAYDSIDRGIEKLLKSRIKPWTVVELSYKSLGSERLQKIRGKKRSRQVIYKHLYKLRDKGLVKEVSKGKWAWIWGGASDLHPSKIREFPEIQELKQACQSGAFLCNYNQTLFSEPEEDELVLALRGPLPPKGKRLDHAKSDPRGRQVGCMYIHTDIKDTTRIWSFVESWKNRFLIEEPYFLYDVFSWLFDNRGIIAELGIDIDYFTGKKSIKDLPNEKIRELKKAIFGNSRYIQTVFSVDIIALFKWLETSKGKELLATIFKIPKYRSKAEDIASGWASGEKRC